MERSSLSEKYVIDQEKVYTFEEIRPVVLKCIRERAKYLGMFYKHMPRDLFDKYAKLALYDYGAIRDVKTEAKGIGIIEDFLKSAFQSIGSTIGYGTIESKTENEIVFGMYGGCALVDGWREMGLNDEDVDYLCKIACYGDKGQCESLGLEGYFTCTMTDSGCDCCKMVVRTRKE